MTPSRCGSRGSHLRLELLGGHVGPAPPWRTQCSRRCCGGATRPGCRMDDGAAPASFLEQEAARCLRVLAHPVERVVAPAPELQPPPPEPLPAPIVTPREACEGGALCSGLTLCRRLFRARAMGRLRASGDPHRGIEHCRRARGLSTLRTLVLGARRRSAEPGCAGAALAATAPDQVRPRRAQGVRPESPCAGQKRVDRVASAALCPLASSMAGAAGQIASQHTATGLTPARGTGRELYR